MVSLLTAIRKELDSYSTTYASGYHFLLSVCLPAGPANYKLLKLSAINSAGVDQFNMLAYDYAGSWDTTTGHQANLYPDPANPLDTPFSTNAAIQVYITAGVPANKIMLGLPLYGRAFENTAGLGQTCSGVGSGSWENGIWDYKVLPRSGRETDDAMAGASYSYNSAIEEFISYDNVASVQKKVTYLQSKGLGGTMFWEASGDRADSGRLWIPKAKLSRYTPEEVFASIRSGMAESLQRAYILAIEAKPLDFHLAAYPTRRTKRKTSGGSNSSTTMLQDMESIKRAAVLPPGLADENTN
ncbi:glycosyl hydrolases family 18-domain-containing protein [Xylariaceae sp. FL1651]|nr:glycosyl hydrolases family 18-domain-containing protein [Xylariaceae sp. FL1651]